MRLIGLLLLLASSRAIAAAGSSLPAPTASLVLTVSHPAPLREVQELDPATIRYADEYGVLENLLSPLIEIDSNGQPIPGVAESLSWHGNDLHLLIRASAKTSSGQPITADDALFSLKRQLLLGKNTHGRLGDILCPGLHLKSIDDDCPGIRANGRELILTPATGKPFLVPMLAAVDFGIITRSSVDPKSLGIKSYRETSGPYYLDSIAPDGSFTLRANQNHWHYAKDLPQAAVYRPTSKAKDSVWPSPFMQFKRHIVDFVPNSSILGKDRFIDYAAQDKTAILSTTFNISRVLLIFTPKGLKGLSQEQRFSIGKTIQRAFWERIASPTHHRLIAKQWFAEQGEGNLTPDLVKTLDAKYASYPEASDAKGLKLSTFGMQLPEVQKALADKLSGLSITSDLGEFEKRQGVSPGSITRDDPDMIIITTDVMWHESIAFLSYSFSQNYFPLSVAEGRIWLNRFMNTEDHDRRLGLVRELHYNALIYPKVVPLVSEPQYSMLRDTWAQEPCEIFSSSPLWRMHHK